MNERIKEMWEEATVSVWPRPGKFTAGEYDHHLAKFAELIVRECMWKIMQRKEDAIDNDWHVDEAMSAAISDISEHFGVEE